MEVVQAFLAESVDFQPDKKVNVAGMFWQLAARKFPASVPPYTLVVVLKMEDEPLNKPFRLGLSLEHRDGGEPVFMSELDVTIEKADEPDATAGNDAVTQIVLRFEDTVLPRAGMFAFRLLIDGEEKGMVKLNAKDASR